MKPLIYALYKGDKFITLGTKKEIAEALVMSPRMVTLKMKNALEIISAFIAETSLKREKAIDRIKNKREV